MPLDQLSASAQGVRTRLVAAARAIVAGLDEPDGLSVV